MANKKENEANKIIKQKAQLWDKFVEFYKGQAFGAVSKSMIDAFVFGLLEKDGMFDDCQTPIDIAIKLKITPQKANNIMLQSAILAENQNFDIVYENSILKALASHARYISTDFISFEIADSRIRLALQKRTQRLNILTDTSFNESIFKVRLKDFGILLNTFVPEGKEDELKESLKKELSKLKKQIMLKQIWNCQLTQSLYKILEGIGTASITSSMSASISVVNTVIVAIQNVRIK